MNESNFWDKDPDAKEAKREKRRDLGPSREMLKFVENYKGELQEGDGVLELGVGEGRNLEAFKDLNLKLHGVELDPSGVEMCLQNLEEKNIKADIKEGSFTDLSAYDNESMKLIITQFAIQNSRTMEDIDHIFSEVHRILSEEGLMFMREQANPFTKDADRETRVAYFTKEEIQEICSKHSLEIVEGHDPVDVGQDPKRVDDKKILWNLILRKINQ